jgi:hypothetical protein
LTYIYVGWRGSFDIYHLFFETHQEPRQVNHLTTANHRTFLLSYPTSISSPLDSSAFVFPAHLLFTNMRRSLLTFVKIAAGAASF